MARLDRVIASLALAACSVGCGAALASQSAIDWSQAEAHFRVGEERATNVYTRKEASVCGGRWRLHADAVDDGAFSADILAGFPQQFQLREAIGAAEFFRLEVMDQSIMRSADDEAEALLFKALDGDSLAFRTYFEALGLCSTKPENVRDDGVGSQTKGALDAPAEG